MVSMPLLIHRFLRHHYQESLNKLMKNLMSTSPSFIRCIVPNEFKQPGK